MKSINEFTSNTNLKVGRHIWQNSFIIIFLVLTFSCSTSKRIVKTRLIDNETFELTEISKDNTYGFTANNPIKVGSADQEEGPINERRYLNALAGPAGEKVSYSRAGSCCSTRSKHGIFGYILLDNYSVTWEGAKDTVSIYINMYDNGLLKAPMGFKIKE